ncbi:MAG: hypothetical protein JOZ60_00370 [Verrucomicrobia bacterium]|nr:hypothetical protein [Verrucomicrobiota bacterium]
MSANIETPHRWPPNKPEERAKLRAARRAQELHNANLELVPKASENQIAQQLMLFDNSSEYG